MWHVFVCVMYTCSSVQQCVCDSAKGSACSVSVCPSLQCCVVHLIPTVVLLLLLLLVITATAGRGSDSSYRSQFCSLMDRVDEV
jgi:hypothetical protein